MAADTDTLTAPVLTDGIPEDLIEKATQAVWKDAFRVPYTDTDSLSWQYCRDCAVAAFKVVDLPALLSAARAWADLPKTAEELHHMRNSLVNRAVLAEAERDAALKRAEAAEKALKRIGNISVGHPVSWAHAIVREVLPDFVRGTHVG